MEQKKHSSCCVLPRNQKKEGFIFGIFYGLIPHTFCILFVIFSVLGATSTAFFFKGFLLNRNFFYYLIILSFSFSTISAIFYLQKNKILSLTGIKRSWRYLSILYGITIVVNLILFLVIFPATANFSQRGDFVKGLTTQKTLVILRVDIPCTGHASLITSELKKLDGIREIKFRLPNLFDVYYDDSRLTQEEILNLEVFKTYKTEITK